MAVRAVRAGQEGPGRAGPPGDRAPASCSRRGVRDAPGPAGGGPDPGVPRGAVGVPAAAAAPDRRLHPQAPGPVPHGLTVTAPAPAAPGAGLRARLHTEPAPGAGTGAAPGTGTGQLREPGPGQLREPGQLWEP